MDNGQNQSGENRQTEDQASGRPQIKKPVFIATAEMNIFNRTKVMLGQDFEYEVVLMEPDMFKKMYDTWYMQQVSAEEKANIVKNSQNEKLREDARNTALMIRKMFCEDMGEDESKFQFVSFQDYELKKILHKNNRNVTNKQVMETIEFLRVFEFLGVYGNAKGKPKYCLRITPEENIKYCEDMMAIIAGNIENEKAEIKRYKQTVRKMKTQISKVNAAKSKLHSEGDSEKKQGDS